MRNIIQRVSKSETGHKTSLCEGARQTQGREYSKRFMQTFARSNFFRYTVKIEEQRPSLLNYDSRE